MTNKKNSRIQQHPVSHVLRFSGVIFSMTLLLLFAAFFFAPKSVLAETKEGSCGSNIHYSFDSNTETLTLTGSGDMYDYTMLDTPFSGMGIKTLKADGSRITSIGNNAFYGCVNMASISLPNTLTEIGEWAFAGNRNHLKEISIPANVKIIGDHAFAGCLKLEKVAMASSGIKSIGTYAFENCYKLTDIQLPNTITYLGDNVFVECTSLKSIVIPDSLSKIPGGAFSYCSELEKVTIPNTIKKIGAYAFLKCNNLKTVYYYGTLGQWYNIAIEDIELKVNTAKDYILYGSNIELILMTNKPITFTGTVSLSNTSYVYSGALKKPTVTVKHTSGKVLKNGTDYTVTYANNKRVGTATVVVTFKGNYKGTIRKTFTINPIQPKLLSLKSSSKKQMTLKWRKDTGLTGFQIQYANNASFKKAKILTVKGSSVKTTIKKLKSKKTYYARLRAYKKVGGKNYYSTWSNKKAVKIK